MTIGIAASGPRAGLAVYRGLRAVETVGRGAIGGFVSLVAIAQDGTLAQACTQRGGALALFDGADPPPRIAEARLAGLMSSGPDRPEPLIQFTPADPAVGIVTGHRLPNMPGPSGEAPNLHALRLLAAGASPEEAVLRALEAAPEADAGLIAMDLAGRIALGDAPPVLARDDRGRAFVEDPESGLRVAVLHNTIFPVGGLAGLAAGAAVDASLPGDAAPESFLLIGLTVQPGERHAAHIAPDGAVTVTAPGPEWLAGEWEGSVLRRNDPVFQEGRAVGRVTREVYAILRSGRVIGGRGGETVGWRRTGDRA
ncbi:hypothetical protein P2H44_12530 [Albimonas sp. CAU 1670]|uniref:DUF6963 family protein n=1 Tax=Albimonas sp. CAU 1670 TaxID=3032599 RepID=UPI0023DAD998|nr:hypothetical protein [Albimonas sp. CAU 1670]MDF2233381.1 hypothetical protein [Albimonas sp. CAU 1670]